MNKRFANQAVQSAGLTTAKRRGNGIYVINMGPMLQSDLTRDSILETRARKHQLGIRRPGTCEMKYFFVLFEGTLVRPNKTLFKHTSKTMVNIINYKSFQTPPKFPDTSVMQNKIKNVPTGCLFMMLCAVTCWRARSWVRVGISCWCAFPAFDLRASYTLEKLEHGNYELRNYVGILSIKWSMLCTHTILL